MFTLLRVDATSAARRAVLETAHGRVELPAFMPVGTQGTVKGIPAKMLAETGAQVILGNTYHLSLRPGEQVIADLGGLHRFMRWEGPILTDSGGFQLFSLAEQTKVTEQAAIFRSHIDGRRVELSPERSIEIQAALGSDIAMVLDHVIPLPSAGEQVRDACERTIRWAARCRAVPRDRDQLLFGIVQGGLDPELRQSCAEQLISIGFAGYAIGGLSVGEGVGDRNHILESTCPALPSDQPRYLMGVGTPSDVLDAIGRGVDMFDCVIPTRNGRNSLAFTDEGPLRLRNRKHERDARPLEADCPCPACGHSRGYLRHLFMAQEMLGPILLSVHNLTYYQRLMADARQAIEADGFVSFAEQKKLGWTSENEENDVR